MNEQVIKSLLSQAGIKYIGIQQGYKDIPCSVLFNNNKGFTLAISINEFSIDKVKQKILKSLEVK
jgi:hypothetical protein